MKTDTDTDTKGGRLTTVKTIYARAAVLLLALNFCLTGYVVMNIADIQQDQLGETQSQSTTRGPQASGSTGTQPVTGPTTELGTRETKENQ